MGRRITTFTFSAKHPVQFCFTCEQCGMDSGWQPYVFSRSVQAEGNGWDVTLPPSEQKKYYDKANMLLAEDLTAAKKNADMHKYPFSSKCPFCGKLQSWGAKSLWFYCYAFPLLAGGMTTFVLLMVSALKAPWASYVIFGLSAAAFLITFPYVLLRNIKAAKVQHKQLPVIDWNGL